MVGGMSAAGPGRAPQWGRGGEKEGGVTRRGERDSTASGETQGIVISFAPSLAIAPP